MSETDFRERARFWPKGHLYEDFDVGQVFRHHWGRTISKSDTLTAISRTMDARISQFNPANGIVRWATEGLNQNGDKVIDFERANIVRLRHPGGCHETLLAHGKRQLL